MAAVWEYQVEGMGALEHMARRLEILLEEEGWDAKPHFYTLAAMPREVAERYEGGPGLPPPEMAGAFDLKRMEDMTGALGLAEIEMPEFCYENPAEGMNTLLQFLAQMQRGELRGDHDLDRRDLIKLLNKLVPMGFMAFGIAYEAWTLPDTVPEAERLQRSHEHTMHEHPDRIEMRVVCLCSRDGQIVTVMRNRGEVPEFWEYDPSTTSLSGRVPDGMRRLTSLFDQFDTWRSERIKEFVEES